MPLRPKKKALANAEGLGGDEDCRGAVQLPATFMRFTRMEPTVLAP